MLAPTRPFSMHIPVPIPILTPKPHLLLLRNFTTSVPRPHNPRDSQFRRTDFSSQGYSAPYEPNLPTIGPLSQASKHGTPKLTPSMLKEHLDQFVVGQDKAKKVTSVAIYNHYQRIKELRRQEAEEGERRAQRERRALAERERNSHPVENEYPGHIETVDLNTRSPPPISEDSELGTLPLHSSPQTIIEKSNLLLLGPSGVGKTYILSTLAKILEVPFATIDCSALTQAGYIGTDIESSLERLLLAANYNIARCEAGIVFFDEVDKLAKPAVMTHGRDVSGEGVQQGLLKMIEGTTVTVNAKSDRNARTERERGERERGGSREGLSNNGGQAKSEQYTIDTSNILFVFAGAFVGLETIITSRLSSGTTLGFGAQLKFPPHASHNPSSSSSSKITDPPNPLQHILPTDLQTYGLIPELLGRIPIITSLAPLSLTNLVSILTLPKNSLVKQYSALFATYNIHLRFTTAALHAIAERALTTSSPSGSASGSASGSSTSRGLSTHNQGGIGARGLRSIMESVLGETMFWGPGSSIRYCLIDETFVRGYDEGSSQFQTRKERSDGDGEGDGGEGKAMMPRCWARGQQVLFQEAWEREEDSWRGREEGMGKGRGGLGEGRGSLERFREVGNSGM